MPDEEALTAYIASFVRHFQSEHLKEEAISRSVSWHSSLETAKKEILEKREKQAIERRQQIQRRAELMKVRTMKVPVTVPTKAVHFVPTVSTSMVQTMSVASFVSVHGDESHDTPKTSTEAAVSASAGNAENRDLTSSEAQKSKSEALEFNRLSIGSNCSKSSQRRQQSSSSRLEQQQLKLELESKRIKIQVEQYQRQKEEELPQLQQKMQLLEMEHELRQCGGESERATVDGSKVLDVGKDLELDDNSVAGSEAVKGFMAPMVSLSDVRTYL